MNRREFCTGAGSAVILSASQLLARAAQAATFPAEVDPNPAGGYTLKPPRQFLFMDYRHINPGDLSWRSPDGKNLPTAGPPGPPVEARADAENVARGIRLVAQKATKEGPIAGLPNHIIHDDGRYLLQLQPKVVYQVTPDTDVTFDMYVPLAGKKSFLKMTRSFYVPPYDIESYDAVGITYSLGIITRFQ